MKIHSLKVKGAIGFKKGLGLDEIEVDFTGLSGLVALAGQNGFGKTTLLENLSPYRQFASRAGALRHHFFLRDSFRDLTFEYGGNIYRTLIKVDAESDRTEGYVWKNGQPMIDGKVTNYSRYIENLLGSSNLFYNSVFCAQNSAKMSDMTTGDLKKLFVEFLRLDRLSGYEQAAKQCGNVLDSSGQQIQRNIDGLQDRIGGFNSLENDIEQAEISKNASSGLLAEIIIEVNQKQKEIDLLTEIEAKNSVNIERRKDLEKDIKTLQDERTNRYHDDFEEKNKIDLEISRKNSALNSFRFVLARKDAIVQASDNTKALEYELSAARERDGELGQTMEDLYEKMEAKGKEIRSLWNEIKGIEENPSRQEIDGQAKKLNESLKTIQGSIDLLIRERSEARQSFDLVRIDSDIRTCKDSMALLDKRGDCPVENPKCAFVISAIKARDRLGNLEKERRDLVEEIEKQVSDIDARGKALRSKHNEIIMNVIGMAYADNDLKTKDDLAMWEIKARIAELEASLANIKTAITDLQKQRQEKRVRIDQLKVDLDQARELAKKLPEIQQAQAQVERLEKEIKDIETSIQEKRDQYTRYDFQSTSRLNDLEKRLAAVNKLIDGDAGKKLAGAREILSASEKEKERISDEIKSKDEQIAVLKQRLEEKAAVEKEIARAQEELGRVTAEASQWRYLQNACGKSGLQALEIDGVAPLITGYANDLLTSTFGPNFSVRLITQDPETGKEVLDIVVIRGDGSETSLENLSGGEKVWVLKSLRLAMTLVSKQKSGRDFGTIFCDEEDGALDTEKSQSFIGLYRAIMGVGGFSTCCYISHNNDVISMADHTIQFSREGIRVA